MLTRCIKNVQFKHNSMKVVVVARSLYLVHSLKCQTKRTNSNFQAPAHFKENSPVAMPSAKFAALDSAEKRKQKCVQFPLF